MRKVTSCMNCGATPKPPDRLAAHGLCYACYRRDDRKEKRQAEAADPFTDKWNPGIRKAHKKLFRGMTSVMTGLSDLGASKADVLMVRRVIDPYLAPIAQYLSVEAMNSEQDSETAVHCSQTHAIVAVHAERSLEK
jgi:hypothetical protein